MKLGKEEIQKIVLAGLMLAGVVYCYFSMLLGPLNAKEARSEARIRELAPMIETAQKQIKKTERLELQAPEVLATLESINALIPEGAPVAWFPPRIAEFFKRHGIEKAATRFTSEAADKDLAGYRRLLWSVDLPKAEFVPLAIALAGLENEEPLLEIVTLQIDALQDDPQHQHVVLSISNIARQ